VTVTTLKGANVLDAGPFNDTVTFTNNTNGIGNTTRGVSLTVNPINITLSSPANGDPFTSCSYYSPVGPPTFSWTTSGGILKSLELQFSPENDPSKVVKVKATSAQLAQMSLQVKSSTWKSILLLPGSAGGNVKWKAVGTKGNKKTADSDGRSFLVEGLEAVGNAALSQLPSPTLSWENNCNIKFKVWFYANPDYYNDPKASGAKTSLSFSITNPNGKGGISTQEGVSTWDLTGQWTKIKNLGSTIYWHVESSDVTKRSVKTGPMNFVITP
jgi:hypothetical protein